MRLSRRGEFVRTDIWREGEYLDLWSVPHFLSGIVVGLSIYLFGFDARSGIVIGLLLLIAYEMFEVIVKIEETRMNRVLDVVVGMASLTPVLLYAPQFTQTEVIIALGSVGTVDGVLSFFGWRASQKAAVLEAKLKAEYQRERERLARRREAMRNRWRARRDKWGIKKRVLKPQQIDPEPRNDIQ